jgi:multiple sugar transport system ATP-binding protein
VRADKSYRAEIGDMVSISVPADICHLFDGKDGARIGA